MTLLYEGHPAETISLNICSAKDLLSPTIFGLKYDEKLELFISDFRDMKKVMPVDFERDKNVVLGTNMASKHFEKATEQLVNSGNNILSLEFSEV